MSDDAKPREPAWIERLSKMGAAAESRRSKLKGTFGAANTARSVTLARASPRSAFTETTIPELSHQ